MNIGDFCYSLQFNNYLIKTHKICNVFFGQRTPFKVNLKAFLSFEWNSCLVQLSSQCFLVDCL